MYKMADLLIIPFGWGGMLSHFLFQNKMPCLLQIKITDGKGGTL
ncbi:hypothetical protein MUS_3920 [Bacillus velezensis YAU B9601-Y2]|uniref:Uncharacterized protein n=1 Tax=Bacillus amyloliquefaciens (strain Y2) TaxID=1155777 RepID=I2CAV2_BACAY|nr:hypothetical protein MUS_3920 [Bacillus velezensis YAU B9601-Y2]AMQ71982.1 hypothetical protein BAMY6614_00955 [Bacillus amyloliquefaciens UMAF6614]